MLLRGTVLTAAAATALALLSGCGDDEPSERQSAPSLPDTTSSAPAPSASSAPSASATTTPSAAPSFPPQATDLEQGGTYFSVYLAVDRTESVTPELEAAEEAAEAVGDYDAATGEVDCDRGAREALGLARTGSYFATSIPFATAADAKAFVDAYGPGVVGTARITAFCLD